MKGMREVGFRIALGCCMSIIIIKFELSEVDCPSDFDKSSSGKIAPICWAAAKILYESEMAMGMGTGWDSHSHFDYYREYWEWE